MTDPTTARIFETLGWLMTRIKDNQIRHQLKRRKPRTLDELAELQETEKLIRDAFKHLAETFEDGVEVTV